MKVNPLIRRQRAVEATAKRFDGKPLVFGRADCAKMVGFHLRQLGRRVSLLEKAGPYSSEVGAARALKKLGFRNLVDGMDAAGLERIPPAAALMGDVLALPAAEDWEDGDPVALMIAFGNGRAFGILPAPGTGERIFGVVQPFLFVTAWRALRNG